MLSIQQLNDNARRFLMDSALAIEEMRFISPPADTPPCRLIITPGVAELPPHLKTSLAAQIRDYSDFSEKNDPHHEHDFGAVLVAGERVFWKIDYYDKSLTNWADPTGPNCVRVLTIMLAEEY